MNCQRRSPMRRHARAFASFGFGVLTLASPVAAQVEDHLQCFKARDTTNPAVSSYLLTLKTQQPPFLSSRDCQIKSRPDLFCTHVQKTQVVPSPPGLSDAFSQASNFACYKVRGRCSPDQERFNLNMKDQFGSERFLTIGSVKYVCAPAIFGECGQTYGQCNGTCPPGQACSTIESGSAHCECVPDPPCNPSSDSQTCSTGSCPTDHVCTSAFGGCACFPTCASTFPECGGHQSCGAVKHCGNVGGACACIPNNDCGDLQQPQCTGGPCPSGMSCNPSGPTGCQCM